MPVDAPVAVRNHQPGPLVFSKNGEANDYFEFAGAGDPNGGDVLMVPADLLQNVQFRRNVTLGLLTVEDDSSVGEQAAVAQREAWQHQQAQRADDAVASLEQTSDNDIVGVECVGPATRPGESVCGTALSQRADSLRVNPPLCQMHKHLEGQFRLQETGRLDGAGRPEALWVKANSGS